MATKHKSPARKQVKETIRASISFSSEDYTRLEETALKKRVSLAWVVREAVREYLESEQEDQGKSQI